MAIMDTNLVLMENQTFGAAAGPSYAYSNLVDLGPLGLDPGTNHPTYPGWWNPSKLILNVVTAAASATAPDAASYLNLTLCGVGSTTSAVTAQIAYHREFVSSGDLKYDYWHVSYRMLWSVAVPRVTRKIAFLKANLSTKGYIKLNAWIAFDGQALAIPNDNYVQP